VVIHQEFVQQIHGIYIAKPLILVVYKSVPALLFVAYTQKKKILLTRTGSGDLFS